jgi:hypothetical protein
MINISWSVNYNNIIVLNFILLDFFDLNKINDRVVWSLFTLWNQFKESKPQQPEQIDSLFKTYFFFLWNSLKLYRSKKLNIYFSFLQFKFNWEEALKESVGFNHHSILKTHHLLNVSYPIALSFL